MTPSTQQQDGDTVPPRITMCTRYATPKHPRNTRLETKRRCEQY